ncbi:uncharacterized protein LOC111354521 [Spodoptera litura]|uniref:Uncharacterized protein LOC111354521 n=1 Tax=Spodoptera litura TaxID=69820 RepID=A0A9J7E8L4_SPOLT|nr:uncharacterized protein LOC111354521 [Spodoptera litura]
MCRYTFFTRKQAEHENIDDFLTDLENKSRECDFGTLRESMIRDIFIANLHIDFSHIRQRLLQEPDLTYHRMRELAKTLIVAQQDAEKIVKKSGVVDGAEVMHLSQRSSGRRVCRQRASSQASHRATRRSPSLMRQPTSTCGRCGQSHRARCPATGVQCRSCNSFGHFARFCYKNKNVSQSHSQHTVGILSRQSSRNHPHAQSYSQPQKQSYSQSQKQPVVGLHTHTRNSQSQVNLHDDNANCSERLHKQNKNKNSHIVEKSHKNVSTVIQSHKNTNNRYTKKSHNCQSKYRHLRIKNSQVSENSSSGSWKINIHVGKHKLNCIIDSGADVNIVSVKNFKSLKLSMSHINNCLRLPVTLILFPLCYD